MLSLLHCPVTLGKQEPHIEFLICARGMGREGTGLCGLKDFKLQCPGSSLGQKSWVEEEDPQAIIPTCSEHLPGVCVGGRGVL